MNSFEINWFDLVALGVIVLGVFVGRKRGMSSELLVMIQWLVIVFGAAFAVAPVGGWLTDVSGLNPAFCHITGYLVAAVAVKLIFLLIKNMAGEKLIGSDTFGDWEYYLGMLGGGVRFFCILLFGLAILHAPYTSDAELKKQLESQRENLGSVYFPPFGSIQRVVFYESFTGKLAREYFSAQLIQVDPNARARERENIGQQRARDVSDVIDPKKK